MADAAPTRFEFAFDWRYRLAGRAFGVTPSSTGVEVDGKRLVARFGPWRVETPISNVQEVRASGPYGVPKTIGPAHLSFSDRGLTFATNATRGVCVTFRDPVRGIDPLGVVRHPGLTVTVADVDGLIEALRAEGTPRRDLDEVRQEQAAEDELHTMTTRELRDLADERGIAHTSSMKKAELVALLEARLDDQLVDELTSGS
jgi:Rho termination factor, N-terminal domain